MPRILRFLTGLASVVLALWLATGTAQACACCSSRASRYVATEQLGEQRLREIGEMTFDTDAALATGEADAPAEFQAFGTSFQLVVTRTDQEMVFAFRNEAGRVATLTLAIPDTISIFEVDPRSGVPDRGLGPLLYKERQLTAAARGTGVFQSWVGADQKISLVLHGRGRGCAEASDFTDWTLLIHGPSGNLTLYGALTSSVR